MPSSEGQNPLSRKALEFLYHHIFLPPEVPQQDDYEPGLDVALIMIVQEGLAALKSQTARQQHDAIIAATGMLRAMQNIHKGGDIETLQLFHAFDDLCRRGTPIALHIRAQNAGVLITKIEEQTQFDLFELSPLNEAAMATKGRLQRSFPGASVLINKKEFQKPDFKQSLANTLASMSSHAVVGMQPKASKAGQLHDEDRDTVHPGIVTEVLMAVLSQVGQPITPKSIVKNTREEVRWKETRSPWRRSATWLLIRVALQLTLTRSPGSRALYKEALLHVMCHVAQHALAASFHSDGLYVMNAKIAQRVLKLGNQLGEAISKHVYEATIKVHAELKSRWATVQEQQSRRLDLSRLPILDFQRDTLVSLPDLDAHISTIVKRQGNRQTTKAVHSPSLIKFPAGQLPSLSTFEYRYNNVYALANLYGFEDWVASHCCHWARHRSTATIAESSKAIIALIKDYHRIAGFHYAQNPEALSIMVLTIFELWIACDIGVTAAIPLLKEYAPGTNQDILQNLLLPFKSQMKRLREVEEYLHTRAEEASHPYSELFLNFGTCESFAVRYFDTCNQLQATLKQINDRATQQRQAKVDDLHRKHQEYSRLMDQYNSVSCEYRTVVVDQTNRFTEQRHRRDCKKCQYKSRASRITIAVHEWPVPNNDLKAKALLFETQVPAVFATWREGTIFLLNDVLRGHSGGSRPRSLHGLRSDPHMRSYSTTSNGTYRCTLMSETKANVGTHRMLKQASMASERDVCLNNGLEYRYFDSNTNTFLEEVTFSENTAYTYTYSLPKCSATLQRYIFRPATAKDGPPPNKVISDQSSCPNHMSHEEFKELGSLALGHRIQWYNLLLQLCAPNIDFRKDETALVILQCIYQAGPPSENGETLRAAHIAIKDEVLGQQIVDSVKVALGRVKKNWESAQSLCIFSAVIGRVLSLSDSTATYQRCVETLKEIRNVAFGWVNYLRDRVHKAESLTERTELQSKCVDVALICALSFDVDDVVLRDMLCSDKNAFILVQCSIIVKETKKTYSKSAEPVFQLLEHRFRKLLRRSCTTLCSAVLSLDAAIKEAWPAFQPSANWQPFSGYEDHWVVTSSNIRGFEDTLTVHYNTLTGELLVNGLPLDRPPREYEDHARWPILFKKMAIEVMPTVVPGMQFSLKQKFKEHEVHVGMDVSSEARDLVVRASRDGKFYTTIPPRLLHDHFPTYYVQNFVHWYNHQDGSLELRPLEKPWDRDPTEMWILSRSRAAPRWQLTRQGSAIVKLKSNTIREIWTILQPLANACSIHVILNPAQTSIEIEAPHIELGFSLDSGTSLMRSREFRWMFVDEDQSMGTLSGFASKLLLKPKSGGQRIALLAEGPISCAQRNNHVQAQVNQSSIVKVHALFIDELLGRLVDHGNLKCKLFLALLHGLTSFCLRDPLTGRTGTEECFSILRSAAVRSFDQLSTSEVGILKEIANLVPGRAFYPANEQMMQTTSFSSKVGFLAQHNGVFEAVKSIFRQARDARLFHPDPDGLQYSLPQISEHLLERDSIRSSTFRTSGFGAEVFKNTGDVRYQSRDTDQCSDRARHAYSLATIIYRNLSSRHWADAMPKDFLWKVSKQADKVWSTSEAEPCVFKFDPRLVASGLDFRQWLALHQQAKPGTPNAPGKFDLMMWFAALASSKDANVEVLQMLALIYTTPSVCKVPIPTVGTCTPSEGYAVSKNMVNGIVQSHVLDLAQSPEGTLLANDGEDWCDFQSRRDDIFSGKQERSVNIITERIWQQWPSRDVFAPQFSDQTTRPSDYVDITAVITLARKTFKMCFDNGQLLNYFARVRDAVLLLPAQIITDPLWPASNPVTPLQSKRFVSLDDVLRLAAPILPENEIMLVEAPCIRQDLPQFHRLSNLIEALHSTSSSTYENEYIQELEQSLQCLEQAPGQPLRDMANTYTIDYLLGYRARCKDRLKALYGIILSHLQQCSDDIDKGSLPHSLDQWPRLCPSSLLRLLNRHHWSKLKEDWKRCVVEYAFAVSAVQRADRLLKAVNSLNKEDLVKEIVNAGHTNWNAHQHPESLLLEVESGILIRDVQEEIAAEMRRPSSSGNAVMQLNMGEGKSSVIVPMLVTSLADTSQLVRVIVAKPQSKQMLQMLISKLGGLVDRRVRLMPFSRSSKLGEADADTVANLVRRCMARGDVLLVQPEHILSLRLMALECCDSSTKQDVGKSLLATQFFFDRFSRDIVDESDENFSTKFELIYTMGTQRQIEFSPNRWTCIQQVLGLVKRFGPMVAKELPGSVEISRADAGSFPRFRILRPEAGELLVGLIATHIWETGIDGFPIARQAQSVRDAVYRYLVAFDLTEREIADVEDLGVGSFWVSDIARSALLLLRGLLAGGILAVVFGNKRWRVNYGLVSDRIPSTQLAVPYRAKDSPTPRSEFSHPDVVLVLTSLSYYYDGLANDDMFTALKHLMRSDQAHVEFGAWIADAPTLPHEFRNLDGINLKDTMQCTIDIFPHLRFGKAVIDYFLASIVFPKAMKEFPHKLSASGWDIGLSKPRPTTGFSGTNDSKTLLPLDVEHLDLPRQKHTNALVLNQILDPDNSVLLMGSSGSNTNSNAERLLEIIIHQLPQVQVILDVGAQILELDNRGLAHRWLELHLSKNDSIQAVVFVNNDDELFVLDRRGHAEPLQTSSYASRLDECLIFLDEAHTRGIDLQLPKHYRAAVTLGANLTKDRLVQACMRMRKLGKGQTVLFCVNCEIEGKIRARISKPPPLPLELEDVLLWSISETFVEIRRAMPLWAVQGERFLKQEQLWNEIVDAGVTNMSKPLATAFLEPEAQTLDDRYRPKGKMNAIAHMGQSSIPRMDEIKDRCSQFKDLQFHASALQEEQERELSPEIEQERQVERPAQATPFKHSLHADVTMLVKSGIVNPGSPAYMPAFQALRDTTAVAGFKVSQLDGNNRLLVTTDFARTVQKGNNSSYTSDAYQRPVQWVLASKAHLLNSPYLMIISPYEAEHLISDINGSSKFTLHLYRPRCIIGHRTFDKLDFMSVPSQASAAHIPRWLLLKLDLFAGQLYLNSYEDYLVVCSLLGLATHVPKDGEIHAADGFIIKDQRGVKPGSSPVQFMQALMSRIRRNGQGIGKTDMGYILEGNILERAHFEGRVVDAA